MVLKIYDRRFSTQLRGLYNAAPPWTPEIERDYYEYLCSDEGKEFAIERQKFRIEERGEMWGFTPPDNDEDSGITAATAIIPWRHQKTTEEQEIHGEDEPNRDGSTNIHQAGNGEQQIETPDTAAEDAGASDNNQESESDWDHMGDEVDLYISRQFLYESESEAYETLKDLRGICVAQLFAHTKILGPKCYTQDGSISGYFEHPGLLMQYIAGFPLPGIAKHAPRQAWPAIIDKSIEIINEITIHQVVNDDVNIRSFIVQPDPANSADSEYKFKLAMIDFGHIRSRRQYPPKEDWRWWQAQQNGERAIGAVMERVLERDLGGGYVYHRTPFCESLIADYLTEP